MESNLSTELLQKAKALLTLKDMLGPYFEEQKAQLLNQSLDLSLIDGVLFLKNLVEIKLISQEELASWSSKLIFKNSASGAKVGMPPVSDAKGEEKEDKMKEMLKSAKPDTKLEALKEALAKEMGIPIKEIELLLKS